MRLTVLAVLSFILLLPAGESAAKPIERTARARTEWRHYVVVPEHVLTAAEKADLAASGFQVQRPLTGGRLLVRMRSDSPVAAGDTRIRQVDPLTAEMKLQPSAYRAVAEGNTIVRVRVFFNDEVAVEAARDAFFAAGGTLEDPFAVAFEPLRSLRGRIPAENLTTFAGDERVFTVYGWRKPRATDWNVLEAQASKVTDVQAAPYNLTGDGVVLSYFELALADSTHQEFGDRLTVKVDCTIDANSQASCQNDRSHPTHTAGTMIAAGSVNSNARGMAPKASLTEFRGDVGPWLTTKNTGLAALGSVADNNSFGYVWGWGQDGGWAWYDGDELIGGYDGWLSATFDHLALTNGTLFVHSAGNEADTTGPTAAPYAHHHTDNDGNPTSDTYCYSSDGSGTDCPAAQCSAGAQFCEKTRHPTHVPYGSINYMASMKNIVSVGATYSDLTITNFSSRGPARDGRVKPEITARGSGVLSTLPGNSYGIMSGTSMAAPVVTGTTALLVEQWRKTTGNSGTPGPLTLKALLLGTADDVGNPGPDYTFGYGFLDAKAAIDTIIADGGTGKRIRKDAASQGSQFDYPVTLGSTQDLRAFISWMDPEVVPMGSQEVAGPTLVNDLDLKIVGPNGTTLPYVLDKNAPTSNATRGVNTVDNNEEVEVKGAAAGTYHVIVTGTRIIASSPQTFVLVTSSDIGGSTPPPCNDFTEPNSTPDTAYGNLPQNRATEARICGSSDVDYFRFVSNATGTVTVNIAATDTPLKATLLVGSSVVGSVNIAAGTTGTLTNPVASSAATQYLVKVEPNGTIGSDGGYTVTASYPFTNAPKRRAARR